MTTHWPRRLRHTRTTDHALCPVANVGVREHGIGDRAADARIHRMQHSTRGPAKTSRCPSADLQHLLVGSVSRRPALEPRLAPEIARALPRSGAPMTREIRDASSRSPTTADDAEPSRPRADATKTLQTNG